MLTNTLAALRRYAARPSADPARYELQDHRYHVRPGILDAAHAVTGLEHSDLQRRAARLAGRLRVAVHAQRPIYGPYKTATEGRRSNWERVGDYAPIVAQRRAFEAAHDLTRDGHAPVSGALVLAHPDGSITHWTDAQGAQWSAAETYGDTLHILKPDALTRSLLFSGDSNNLAALHGFDAAQLNPAEAALLLHVPDALHDHAELLGFPTEPTTNYLESLTLGGVTLTHAADLARRVRFDDAEQVDGADIAL